MFMYLDSDNPLKNFYRNNNQVHELFCFFSTRHGALKHYFNTHVENYYPDNDEDIKWFTPILDLYENSKIEDILANEDLLELFYTKDSGDCIYEIPVDIHKF